MKYLWTVLGTWIFFLSHAQNTSGDQQGIRKKAGDYLLEVKGCYNYIDIGVFTQDVQPVPDKELEGSAEYFYPDGSYLVVKLERSAPGHLLKARIPYPGYYIFKITLLVKNQKLNACFDNECNLNHRGNETH
jgi:hypothetical protein